MKNLDSNFNFRPFSTVKPPFRTKNLRCQFRFPAILLGLFIFCSYSLKAQILNDDIKVYAGIDTWVAGGWESSQNPLDVFEPAIHVEIHNSQNDWTVLEMCHTWSTEPPVGVEFQGFQTLDWATEQSYDFDALFLINAFEDDQPWGCSFGSEDDPVYQDWANATSNNVVTSRVPCKWHNDFGTTSFEGVEILGQDFSSLGDGYITSSQLPDPWYTVRPCITWRYGAGNNSVNPLQFGDLSDNSLRVHTCSNRNQPENTPAPGAGYFDTGGSTDGSEVYYSFNLTVSAYVQIELTSNNFDPYLTLYDENMNLINSDNDGLGNYNALVDGVLCPGLYILAAEGASAAEQGDFQVFIDTNPIFSEGAFFENTDVSCGNASDGSISAIIWEGVLPLEYSWNTGQDTYEIYDLDPGLYTVTATDACGDQFTFSTEIVNLDNEAPSINCSLDSLFLPEVGSNVFGTEMIIEEFGISDNCEIAEIVPSELIYDTSDGGNSETIVVTAVDASGNSTTCEIDLNIVSLSEVSPFSDVSVYPNPTENLVQVDFSRANLRGPVTIRVIDMTGKVVKEEQINAVSGIHTLGLEDLSGGIYKLLIQNNQLVHDWTISKK